MEGSRSHLSLGNLGSQDSQEGVYRGRKPERAQFCHRVARSSVSQAMAFREE